MIYVVSDVHSCYQPMIKALKAKGFFESSENKLLLLGDALDRGPDTRRVIDFLLSLHNEGRLIYVKGNHEWLFTECLEKISAGKILEMASEISSYYVNGTFSTLLAIAKMSKVEAINNPDKLVRRVKESDYYNILLPSCVHYYETEKYVFTHGFIPCREVVAFGINFYMYSDQWRDADTAIWRKASWVNGIDMVCKYKVTVPDKTIVVGHIRSWYGHMKYNNVFRLDTFSHDGFLAIDANTVQSQRVNCLCFEE